MKKNKLMMMKAKIKVKIKKKSNRITETVRSITSTITLVRQLKINCSRITTTRKSMMKTQTVLNLKKNKAITEVHIGK